MILGGGPIGISVILALKARGAKKIIVSEISKKRQEFAKLFGAHYVIDPTKEDVVKRCRDLCDQQGVHVVYDCAGVQTGLDQAIHAVRARGTVVNIAIWEKPCSITPNDLTFKERKYMGVATYQIGDFQEVLVSIQCDSQTDICADRDSGCHLCGRHETSRDDHSEDQVDGG